MYLFLEQLKANHALELKVVTGASAGSINSLVAALSSCRPPNALPFEDPGWKAWGDVGYKDLFDRTRASPRSLFTREPLERSFDRLRAIMQEGLPTSCDVVLGVVVTRVNARQVELQRGLSVPRLEEKFVVRIQGRGAGVAPRLSNYVNPASHVPQPLLPFVDDSTDPYAGDRNLTQLRGLLFASSAFPVAFAPQPIEYCLSKPPKEGEVATLANIDCSTPELIDLFVDGGVFDNNPLRLAYLLADSQLGVDARGWPQWKDLESSEAAVGSERASSGDIVHLYVDPDTSAYPPEVDAALGAKDEGIVSQFFKLGGGFVETARAKELDQLASERKDLAKRMRLTVTQYPTASEQLNAFVGFFERDFRIFDFYLGMYDAYHELKSSQGWSGAAFDVDGLVTAYAAQAPAQWKPFTCMLSMFEPGHEGSRGDCSGPELSRFRTLLQVSIDRLYEACRPTQQTLAYAISGYHQHCTRSRQGYEAPVVPGVDPILPAARTRNVGETSFDYFMRLLGEYRFDFTDLGLASEDSTLGRLAIRRALDEMMGAWADAQPTFADRTIAKTVGRIALNNIQFSPPRMSGHLVLGTVIEAGGSIVPFGWKSHWFQATGALELNNFFSVLTPGEQRLAFLLVTGPEFHLSFLSNAIFQPRVALRAGAQLGVRDGFGTHSCANSSDPRWCTQGVVEGVFSLSLLERVRGQFAFQTYPRLYGNDTRWYNLQFGIGVQFF
jgi:predicted acylesterase/phospholipase RssA